MKETTVFLFVLILFIMSLVWLFLSYKNRKKDSRTIIYEVRKPEDFKDVLFDEFWDDPNLDTLKINKKPSSPPR